jgi:NhaA family Na+:H+ antiporter
MEREMCALLVFSKIGVSNGSCCGRYVPGGINADIAGVIAAVAVPASAPAPAGSHAHAMVGGLCSTS